MKLFLVQTVFFCSFIITSLACGPGRSGGRRRNARKMTPLVYKQYSPNLSENTMIASGPSEGRITRNDQRYKDLVPNYNPDILFRDIEGTGASRLMTQRLKEKLDILSISVMNQWPGVRLRVLKGWDEQNFHASHSLHYEGRAVDLSTSDRDRTKNGMLARLAIQAGFDWVFYESRYHIHASVKSEKTHSLRPEGCFLGTSNVKSKSRGIITINQLEIGEEVLAVNNENQLVFSKVLMFLDLDAYAKKLYYFIKTETNNVIALTESHLIFVSDSPNKPAEVDFAAFIKPGMYIFVPEQSVFSRNKNYTEKVIKKLNKNEISKIKLVKVIDVRNEIKSGAFAPLTFEGTIIVDGVVASCYAHIINQSLAHLGFLPVRLLDIFLSLLSNLRNNYLGKSDRLDELSKSESILIKNEIKKPIKVDRRVVNSKIINLIDTKNNKTNDNIQYDLHQSFKPQQGIHWYAYFLYYLAKIIIPTDYMYH